MQLRSLWKLLVIGFFAFLVAACNPIASFSVSPTPVKAGIEATFDASSTMVDVLPKGNKAKSYAWDFGDGSTGSGIAAKHTYATAGTFKV
jgi:PKD repeat protein